MSVRPILIATHSRNTTSNAIIGALKKRNQTPYVVHTDAVCQTTTRFLYEFKDGKPLLTFGEWQLDLTEVGSAWYWRAIVKHPSPDIEREMQKTLWGVWEAVDEKAWFNHPYRIKRTQNKLMQLRYAHKVGLAAIPSIATNSHDLLTDRLPGTLIVKMPGKGILYKEGDLNVLYTTVLNTESAASTANPFPGMYQPFISKKKEWRITVVGDKVFSTAIYTDQQSRVDWRPNAHNKEAVRFIAEEFPIETAEKCKKLLQILGLRYGAFDFIETEGNELYFVEVNTNGQFMWLEEDLGLPISEAIADELIAIARD